jgi:nitroreductase
MTIQEAIEARHSVRAYKDQPLTEEVVNVLNEKIAELNKLGNLHIQLIQNEPKAFQGKLAKYGKFSGVRNYLVMAGKKADDLNERIGYYGEQLVLMSQTLGLNTCWVGLSYSKVPGTYVLEDGEKIACYIALGYGENQGVGHKVKTVEQVSNASDVTPSWFKKGVEAALLAPTAVNQQKFSFELVDRKNGRPQVIAKKGFSMIGYTQLDLGIVKCHFEIGAGKENFEWV